MTTNRIARAALDLTFRAYCAAARDAGFDTTNWSLVHGSPTYGRHYKLVILTESNGHGAHPLAGGFGHIGNTAREADDFLFAQERVLRVTRALGA